MWVTSTIRSHSAQITSPRVVKHILFNPLFSVQLLHEQIQIHRQNSILEKTCSCNRIKLKYQATKKKIKSTRKHRRLCTYQCNAGGGGGGGGRQGIGWGFDFFPKFAIKFPAHGQIIPVKCNQISPPQAAHCCQSQSWQRKAQ